MDSTEIIAATSKLNGEIYDKLGEEYYAFTAVFDGETAYVNFLGNPMWREDEDERTYDEASDTYEPLLEFLRRNAAEEISKVAQLRNLWSNGG